MVSFTQVNSFDELVGDVKAQNEGTLFEYEYLAFENHREFVEFLIESDREFSDSFVAGIVRSEDVRELFNQRAIFGDLFQIRFRSLILGRERLRINLSKCCIIWWREMSCVKC